MDEEKMIEEIVKQVMKSIKGDLEYKTTSDEPVRKCEKDYSNVEIDSTRDYPLGKKRPELIKTPTNKKLDDITLDNVLNGTITSKDIRISPETLELQAKIAEDVNRDSLARNLRRASELTAVSDERILEIYNAMRPNRSTKQELLDIADELEHKYNAVINSNFIREAAEIYEKRGLLRKE